MAHRANRTYPAAAADMNAIREIIRAVLRANGWSQNELARQIGVSHPTISHIMTGRTENAQPHFISRFALVAAPVLGMPVADAEAHLLALAGQRATHPSEPQVERSPLEVLRQLARRLVSISELLIDEQRRSIGSETKTLAPTNKSDRMPIDMGGSVEMVQLLGGAPGETVPWLPVVPYARAETLVAWQVPSDQGDLPAGSIAIVDRDQTWEPGRRVIVQVDEVDGGPVYEIGVLRRLVHREGDAWMVARLDGTMLAFDNDDEARDRVLGLIISTVRPERPTGAH